MFKTNIFSGDTYYETDKMKVSSDGTTFTKMGQTWVGSNGAQIQQTGNQLMNTKTGVMSAWGDPFKEER